MKFEHASSSWLTVATIQNFAAWPLSRTPLASPSSKWCRKLWRRTLSTRSRRSPRHWGRSATQPCGRLQNLCWSSWCSLEARPERHCCPCVSANTSTRCCPSQAKLSDRLHPTDPFETHELPKCSPPRPTRQTFINPPPRPVLRAMFLTSLYAYGGRYYCFYACLTFVPTPAILSPLYPILSLFDVFDPSPFPYDSITWLPIRPSAGSKYRLR